MQDLLQQSTACTKVQGTTDHSSWNKIAVQNV